MFDYNLQQLSPYSLSVIVLSILSEYGQAVCKQMQTSVSAFTACIILLKQLNTMGKYRITTNNSPGDY